MPMSTLELVQRMLRDRWQSDWFPGSRLAADTMPTASDEAETGAVRPVRGVASPRD